MELQRKSEPKAHNHKRPLNRSITAGCILFLIFLCITLSIANITLYSRYVYDDYRGYITNILNYTLKQIDADDLRICIASRQESECYKKTLLFMDQLMENFGDIGCTNKSLVFSAARIE